MMKFVIRDAIWPQDRAAARSFIDGSQKFEKTFEPNRRVDSTVASEYFDVLIDAAANHGGIVRIAEAGGRAAGWVVAWIELDDPYVLAEELRYAYISELFVEEDFRGMGIGRALIGECEAWGRAQGTRVMQIGVLPGNDRAAKIYGRAGYAPYGWRLRKYIA
ncbi:MAG: GNAT family N-acetyltransferase [Rhizomicrobium sp.]